VRESELATVVTGDDAVDLENGVPIELHRAALGTKLERVGRGLEVTKRFQLQPMRCMPTAISSTYTGEGYAFE
jgi:hypothetical protein